MERIAVGVDGSQHSNTALRWAIEEARCHDATLTVVLVAERPTAFIAATTDAQIRSDLQRAEDELHGVLRGVADLLEGVDVGRHVAHGDPRAVLSEMSSEAGLLVIGSRGHGEIAGLFLGSVGQYLVTHASCPVTVVRGEAGGEAG